MEEALEKGLAAFWREHRGGVRKNVFCQSCSTS